MVGVIVNSGQENGCRCFRLHMCQLQSPSESPLYGFRSQFPSPPPFALEGVISTWQKGRQQNSTETCHRSSDDTSRQGEDERSGRGCGLAPIAAVSVAIFAVLRPDPSGSCNLATGHETPHHPLVFFRFRCRRSTPRHPTPGIAGSGSTRRQRLGLKLVLPAGWSKAGCFPRWFLS